MLEKGLAYVLCKIGVDRQSLGLLLEYMFEGANLGLDCRNNTY